MKIKNFQAVKFPKLKKAKLSGDLGGNLNMEQKTNKAKTEEVRMGEVIVARNPTVLSSLSIGSCVAIMLYDKKNKIGGVAHTMLPKSEGMDNMKKPGKFVDKAIENLIKKMEQWGSKRRDIVAKLVGGANMFPDLNVQNIGDENITAARAKLKTEGIKITNEDIGGNEGRSIEFDLETGDVNVKTRLPDVDRFG